MFENRAPELSQARLHYALLDLWIRLSVNALSGPLIFG
jgi:hypothetical protein